MPDPGILFPVFYILAFAVTFILMIVFCLKRGYNLRSILLMMAFVSLLTVIGSRLLTIPFNEWGEIIRTGSASEHNDRLAIGGLLFGLAGLIISIRYFGVNKGVLELYAWITPIGLGIQKLGCFFNGCCYGRPSDLFWSVSYPMGTHAHFDHWAAGLIEENAAFSLAVHPVQIYEAILFFTAAFIVLMTLKTWEKTGSALLFSLFIFLVFRFAMEFVRDPASSSFNGNYILGLRLFQWALIITGLILGLVLLFYEKRSRYDLFSGSGEVPGFGSSLIQVLGISILVYWFRGLFSTFELMSLEIRFIPAVVLAGIYLFKGAVQIRYRLVPAALLLFPVFLIAQSFQQDSAAGSKYRRIDFGFSGGTMYSEMAFNPHEGSCGTVYTREQYKHRYRIGGMGYSQVTEAGKAITTQGINVYAGGNKENNLTWDREHAFLIAGINPYIKYDMKWIGFGGGLHVGNLRWVPVDPVDERTFENGTRSSPLMPAFYARLGRSDIIDLRYSYGFAFPSPYPGLTQELSAGSGFGQKKDYSLRLGIYFPTGTMFLSGEALLNKQFGFNLMVLFGGQSIWYDMNNPVRATFGLNYRFGFEN